MSHVTRRQLLSSFLGNLAAAAGTVVVLAHAVLGEEPAAASEVDTQPLADLQERADQVAAEHGSLDGEEDVQEVSFVNGGFRNGGGGGGFRKGAFANGGFGNGGFRKGAFANGGGGGGFRNGGFANGGGGGGGFRNGAFRNF